jgi:hypothetical protein
MIITWFKRNKNQNPLRINHGNLVTHSIKRHYNQRNERKHVYKMILMCFHTSILASKLLDLQEFSNVRFPMSKKRVPISDLLLPYITGVNKCKFRPRHRISRPRRRISALGTGLRAPGVKTECEILFC